MKKLILPIIFTIASSFLFSCHKKEPLKDAPPLMLLPQKEGKKLSDAELKGISLTYFVNEQSRKRVPDFKRAENSGFQKGILSSYDVAQLSTVNNINIYYLSYPNGQEDTFQIIYSVLSDEEARKDKCFCDLSLMSITRNGKAVSRSEIVSDADVFSFDK